MEREGSQALFLFVPGRVVCLYHSEKTYFTYSTPHFVSPPLLHLNIFPLPPLPSRVCSPATPAVPRTLASALCTPSPLSSLFSLSTTSWLFSPFFFYLPPLYCRGRENNTTPLRSAFSTAALPPPPTTSNLLSFRGVLSRQSEATGERRRGLEERGGGKKKKGQWRIAPPKATSTSERDAAHISGYTVRHKRHLAPPAPVAPLSSALSARCCTPGFLFFN